MESSDPGSHVPLERVVVDAEHEPGRGRTREQEDDEDDRAQPQHRLTVRPSVNGQRCRRKPAVMRV